MKALLISFAVGLVVGYLRKVGAKERLIASAPV